MSTDNTDRIFNDLRDVLDKWCPLTESTRKPKVNNMKTMDNKLFIIILVGITVIFSFPLLMVRLTKNPSSPSSPSPARSELLKAGDKVKFRIGSYNPNIVIKTEWGRDEPIKLAFINTEGHIAYKWYPAAILCKVVEEEADDGLIPLEDVQEVPISQASVDEMDRLDKLEEQNRQWNSNNRLIRLEKFLEARFGIPGHNSKPEPYKVEE